MLIGAGGLGLMCLTLHKAMGGKAAIVADIDPQERGAAQGATAAIYARAADAVKQAQAAKRRVQSRGAQPSPATRSL